MSKYNIHNDFKPYEKIALPLKPFLFPLMNMIIEMKDRITRLPKEIKETRVRIRGYQDKKIKVTIYEPIIIEKKLPCLIYFHGGAFVIKATPYHKNLIFQYVLKTPCKVIFVDYRLAPKNPYPIGVEDCYAAYEWVCNHTRKLDIDKNRIAVAGDSAGGALAAAVCQMSRDRKASAICFQMLIYPVTDERQLTKSIKNYTDTPIWNSILNKRMWKLYLKNGVLHHKEYASPMEAVTFEHLPNAYIEVSEFDCLHDEGINYAEALKKGGAQTELYKTKGTIHGFEIAEKSEIVQQCVERRIKALKRTFQLKKT